MNTTSLPGSFPNGQVQDHLSGPTEFQTQDSSVSSGGKLRKDSLTDSWPGCSGKATLLPCVSSHYCTDSITGWFPPAEASPLLAPAAASVYLWNTQGGAVRPELPGGEVTLKGQQAHLSHHLFCLVISIC